MPRNPVKLPIATPWPPVGLLFLLAMASPATATEGPVAWWKFDGPAAVDAAGGVTDAIEGNSKFMAQGVRGGCLRFDGFTTLVRREAAKAPELPRGFTFQGWVALAAYPWNWTPVIAQRDGDTRGYSFGIDSTGHFGLQLATDFRWTKCLSPEVLSLKTWYHLAVTYDPSFGVRLFLDGRPAGSFPLDKRLSPAKEIDLHLGRNHEKMVPDQLVRDWARFPSWWSLDGLLDEVTIHDRALGEAEITASRDSNKPTAAPDIPARKFPDVAKGAKRFGAYPARLEYYEQWDALWQTAGEPDIVVKFDDLPIQMVFWRGTRYSPCWVSENGKWMADQSLETGVWPDELKRRGGVGAVGCCEHMSDAQCRFSHVRIIENTDARVVVHWRYAMVDAAYRFANYDEVAGKGQFGDEFYYIYPDGVATRDVTGWWPEAVHRIDQETIFLSEPGTRPEDNCELENLQLGKRLSQPRPQGTGHPDGQPEIALQTDHHRQPGNPIRHLLVRGAQGVLAFPVVEPLAGRAHLERRPLCHGPRPGRPFLAQLGHPTQGRVPLWHDRSNTRKAVADGQGLDPPATAQHHRRRVH
jgi:hypothetical protein